MNYKIFKIKNQIEFLNCLEEIEIIDYNNIDENQNLICNNFFASIVIGDQNNILNSLISLRKYLKKKSPSIFPIFFEKKLYLYLLELIQNSNLLINFNSLLCIYYFILFINDSFNYFDKENLFNLLLKKLIYPPSLSLNYSLAICIEFIIKKKEYENIFLNFFSINNILKIITDSNSEKGVNKLFISRHYLLFLRTCIYLCNYLIDINKELFFIEKMMDFFKICLLSNDEISIKFCLIGINELYCINKFPYTYFEKDEFPDLFDYLDFFIDKENIKLAFNALKPFLIFQKNINFLNIRQLFKICKKNLFNEISIFSIKSLYIIIKNSDDSFLDLFISTNYYLKFCNFILIDCIY